MDRNQVGFVPSIYVNNNPDKFLITPPYSADDTLSTLIAWLVVATMLVTTIVRNTFIQNIKGVKIRFYNLGYCDETGSKPFIPDSMRDNMMDE
jgi:hypothetical protein